MRALSATEHDSVRRVLRCLSDERSALDDGGESRGRVYGCLVRLAVTIEHHLGDGDVSLSIRPARRAPLASRALAFASSLLPPAR